MSIETHTHEVLALSNILLKKRNQESTLLKNCFFVSIMNAIETKFQEKLREQFNPVVKQAELDTTIYKMRQKIIKTTNSAIKKITNIISDDDDGNSDKLILGVRNLIESLPRNKFNGPLRENNLSCSYVHCVINPVFTSPASNKHLMW